VFEGSHDAAECTAIDREFGELVEPRSHVFPRNRFSFRLVYGAIKLRRLHVKALHGGCNFVGHRRVRFFELRWKRHPLISRTVGFWYFNSEFEFY